MRGPEEEVDAKAWGHVDRGAGALAQAVSNNRRALQVWKRIVTSFRHVWLLRGWPDLRWSISNGRAHKRRPPAVGGGGALNWPLQQSGAGHLGPLALAPLDGGRGLERRGREGPLPGRFFVDGAEAEREAATRRWEAALQDPQRARRLAAL